MWRKNYFNYCVSAYIIGNISANYISNTTNINFSKYLIFLGLILEIISISIFISQKQWHNRSFLISIAIFFIVGSQAILVQNINPYHSIIIPNIRKEYIGIVENISKTTKGDKAITISLEKENTILYIRGLDKSKVNYGDTILFTAKLNPIKNFSADFDYVKFMAKKKIYSSAFIDQNKAYNKIKIHKCTSVTLKHKIKRLNTTLNLHIEKLYANNKTENISIIKAITTGNRDLISPEQQANFQKSGAMHILALSGLHVGIIYKILSYLLSFLRGSIIKNRIKSTLIITILWSYAIITGFGISIVRAVTMASIYQLLFYSNIKNKGFTALSISALLTTIFNPMAPQSISFQLSYGAMLGIITIYPRLKEIKPLINYKLKFMKNSMFFIRDIAFISISCQVLTAPIIYLTFGSYSPFFLLTNLLVIPLTNIILGLIITNIPLSLVPQIGEHSTQLLEYSLSILNYIVKIISTLQ